MAERDANEPARRTRTLSVVIPVYNERDTWRDLLARVEAVALGDMDMEIVLVDDGSTDGTREQLRELSQGATAAACAAVRTINTAANTAAVPPAAATEIRYRVIFHERNQGKGAALRTGFAAAGGDFVIIQDADLEYDPNDYPAVLRMLRQGRAGVVYGSRFHRRRSRRGYLKNYLANAFLTWLSNRFTGQTLTDMETCYKAFRREVIQRIRIEQDRFGFEPEVTAKLAKLGIAIHEVPIRYDPRSHGEGKKINWRDGLKAIWCIVKYGLRSPRRVQAEG